MCGIAGILSRRRIDQSTLGVMTGRIAHRGPDDQGTWIDQEAGVGLGHRRLAILDLSPAGHQPMVSRDGRYVLIYNGEIYNHLAIRAELERRDCGPAGSRHHWRGHSDTETLLQAIAVWGLHASLQRCVGMFALALWDRRERTLSLARDRFGEKPLYYGRVGGDFVFASELKAFRSHPRFDNAVDRSAVKVLASRGYIPAPISIYEGIGKLEPGRILKLSNGPEATPSCDTYWSYAKVVAAGQQDPIRDEEEALEQLEHVLAEAVASQSIADVPLGAFLSGGIDSSTLVALYQNQSSERVRTFSIGFAESGFNEAHHAKQIAAHFGTVHQEHYVTVAEAQRLIPSLPEIYDEPFGDSSQIPTHLVSRFASEHVKVAISGDGGDELLGGYDRYVAAPLLWSAMSRVPAPLRHGIGRLFEQVSPRTWGKLLPGGSVSGVRLQRMLRRLRRAQSVDEVYLSLLDEFYGETSPVLGADAPPGRTHDLAHCADADPATRMMYGDAMSYLPDDILCKVDRAAMAASLETRAPYLDHRVAELVARIPVSLKIRNGERKHLLKQVLFQHAPKSLFDRPKQGFGVPVGQWVREELRPWAEALLEPSRIKADGFFDARIVQQRWREHLHGERDGIAAIWPILMFQAWLDRQQAA